MQFLKKSFFGLIWSIGIFLFISLMIGIFLSSSITLESKNQASKKEHSAGYEQGYNIGQEYSTILLFISLAIGFGGSFMGKLPGTQKK